MNPKLRSYLQAGARLTGCRSSTVHTGAHDLVTADGDRFVSTLDGGAIRWTGRGWVSAALTFEQLLWRWQPDLKSSASTQHFIDTGRYLPIHESQEA